MYYSKLIEFLFMVLYFITGNKNKFFEVEKMLQPEIKLEQLELDLDEIQSIDSNEVIKHKLLEAQKKHKGEFIIDDSAVCLDALNGLPGPFIKFFLKEMGVGGIYNLTNKMGVSSAKTRVIIGYSKEKEILFFEAETKGDIVSPRGQGNFGFDPIFRPSGFDKTFAEMEVEEKLKISSRKKATQKFKEYYLSKK